MHEPIHMVDLQKQHSRFEDELQKAISEVVLSSRYIKGPQVSAFEESLGEYLGINHVIGCANGTDALQIALMALDLQPGDEVIVPAFTFIATAEVVGLLGLTPVMVDVDPDTFNMTADTIRGALSTKTKAIIPVHLFGQPCPMDEIMDLATEFDLFVIEDTAQAIGSRYTGRDAKERLAGTIGHIGCTSFFPSKNLGCMGDGGALFTNDDQLAAKIRMIANHGQSRQYYHDMLGVNSRLDTLQAAILQVKLPFLDQFNERRRRAADHYDDSFYGQPLIKTPLRLPESYHVFHQYTIQIPPESRELLRQQLAGLDIPSMIYYPVPMYKQKAFERFWQTDRELPNTEKLCNSVLSLPIHSEMDWKLLDYISEGVLQFFK